MQAESHFHIPVQMGDLSLSLRLSFNHDRPVLLLIEDAAAISSRKTMPLPVAPKMFAILQQLRLYFEKGHPIHYQPDSFPGTAFQQRVLRALCQIPAGETRSYGQLARELGTSARAVGNACRRNPLPILIPCHRVVAASSLGGYAGETTGRNAQIKRCLLRHEGVVL